MSADPTHGPKPDLDQDGTSVPPATRPRGLRMVGALVTLARSMPGWESSPISPDTPFLPRRSTVHDLDVTVPVTAVDTEAEELRAGLLDGTVSVAESVAARPEWRELAELAGLDPDDDMCMAVPDAVQDDDGDDQDDVDEVSWP